MISIIFLFNLPQYTCTICIYYTHRYWCNKCRVKFEPDEPGLCYCLILTVTDRHPPGTKVVSLFGQTLNGIFGLQAKQMHRYIVVY